MKFSLIIISILLSLGVAYYFSFIHSNIHRCIDTHVDAHIDACLDEADDVGEMSARFDRVAEHLLHQMNEEEILGQLFLLYLPLNHTEHIFKIKPGVLFLQKGSIPLKAHQQDIALLKKKLSEITDRFEKNNIPPPFVAVDQEFGRVQRIKEGVSVFPSPMTMGQAVETTKDFKNIYWVGFHSCGELKSLGINWPLAPVADLQTNPENPVIGTRSFGSDPELVSGVISHYSRGLYDAGCMSTLKHYPGHGSVSVDSHTNLPVSEKNLEQLESEELIPFMSLAQNAFSIMPAHIRFPSVDAEISTFSSYWLRKYLKEKLQFQGLIITDDLGMRAVTPRLTRDHVSRSALKALRAGADILLFAYGSDSFAPHVFHQLSGMMQEPAFKQRIISSAKKIVNLKLKTGLYQRRLKKLLHETQKRPVVMDAMKSVAEYTGQRKKKQASLREEAPDPVSINQKLSQRGIKYLMGDPIDISLEEVIFFTDENRHKLESSVIDQFSNAYFSFEKLREFSSLFAAPVPVVTVPVVKNKNKKKRIMILHSAEKISPSLKSFLTSQKRPDVIFLTSMNPFPYSKLGKFFRGGDRLVVSFSNSGASKEALRRSLSAIHKIKKASIHY